MLARERAGNPKRGAHAKELVEAAAPLRLSAQTVRDGVPLLSNHEVEPTVKSIYKRG